MFSNFHILFNIIHFVHYVGVIMNVHVHVYKGISQENTVALLEEEISHIKHC